MIDYRWSLLAAGLAAVGLSACGSSSSNTSGVSAFRTQVNAICSNNNAQIEAMPVGSESTISGLRRLDAIATATLGRLQAVSAPAAVKSQFAALVADDSKEATLATTIINDAAAHNAGAVATLLAQIKSLNSRSDAKATALGLSACTANATPSGTANTATGTGTSTSTTPTATSTTPTSTSSTGTATSSSTGTGTSTGG